MECFCTALSRSVSFYNNLLNWLCGLIVRVRVVPRGLLLVIVTENLNGCCHQSHVMRCLLSGSRSANFPEACWLKESSCVSWWLWVSSILGRGFRVESLRSVLLSNELLLFSALLFTLNWKSIAQEKYEPWKLNSGKTIQENDLSSKGDH